MTWPWGRYNAVCGYVLAENKRRVAKDIQK